MASDLFTFEQGSADTTLVAGDYAGYTSVTGSTITYRSGGVDGGLCIEWDGDPAGGINRNLPSAVGVLYISFYIKLNYMPGTPAHCGIAIIYGNSGSEVIAEMRLDSTRQIKLYDKITGAGLLTTSTLTVGEWYRIDWTLDRTAGWQQIQLFTGSALHDPTNYAEEFPADANRAGTLNDSTSTTMDKVYIAPAFLTSGSTTQLRMDRFAWDTVAIPAPYEPPATAEALFTMSTSYVANSTASVDATYVIDATASTGDVSMTQTSGTTATPVESPADTFTIDDPGGTDNLTYNLIADAGGGDTDTVVVTITRASPTEVNPLHRVYLSGNAALTSNWV